MPANLPPQYFETEKKLKTAKTNQEKISILEELLSIVPKHKGTEKLQALLKTKIAKLRSAEHKRPAVARRGPVHIIDKSGAGQVVIIGPPNCGKSMLVKSLTEADPEIGDYPFTTRIPSPYMMKYENTQVQLVDTPPVTADYMESWFPELIKLADGVLLVSDLSSPDCAAALETLFFRLKEKRVVFEGKKASTSKEDVFFFIKKALLVANKKDSPEAEENLEALHLFFGDRFEIIPVSARQEDDIEELKNKIFHLLDVIRVYSKVPGKKIEFDEPFTLKRGSTVIDMAKAVHKDFVEKLKYARLWSKRAYQGQMVHRDYVIEDEDVIELHI